MRKVLNSDTLCAVSIELETLCKATGICFEKAAKSVYEMAKVAKEYHNAYTCGYKERHRRVVHLAYHSRKFRVRKKNRNRIRRMK